MSLATKLLVVGLLASGCESDPTGPATVEIRTEHAAYELIQLVPGASYAGTVRVTITNMGTGPVYLVPFCDRPEKVAYRAERPDGYDVPVSLQDWGFCDLVGVDRPVPPIAVAAGATYTHEVLLEASRRADVREWTGAFQLLYWVQFSEEASIRGVDLIPREDRVSNTFLVLRPPGG